MPGFRCPTCDTLGLQLGPSLELPADGRSDEITLQALSCTSCDFLGVAIYEESRRGASESWHHDGMPLCELDHHRLVRDLRACPAPRDRACGCEVHERYNRVEGYSHVGFRLFRQGGPVFPLKR